MENNVEGRELYLPAPPAGPFAPEERIPRFSLLAGIGAIAAYMLGPVPFVGVVTIIKGASLKANDSTLTSKEISDAVIDYISSPSMLVVALIIQCVSLFMYVYGVSLVRGTKNPFRDLGLRFTPSSLYYLLAGVGLQIVGLVSTFPLQLINEKVEEQDVVTSVRGASGWTFVILMLLVAFVVPVAEEVCFRGLFMRGLAKKVSPFVAVLITGALFAAVHLTDPNALIGAAILFLFSIIASALAMYRGRLDASICLHIGFNMTTVLFLIADRHFL